MLLGHYLQDFQKWLVILEHLMKIKTITMYVRVKDKQLLKNYNKIWKKIERLRSIDFNSKSVYGDNDKYIKGKIKTFADSITTNFY